MFAQRTDQARGISSVSVAGHPKATHICKRLAPLRCWSMADWESDKDSGRIAVTQFCSKVRRSSGGSANSMRAVSTFQ